jgi:glycosyltransferase involved in cell wall biosynthesis
LVSAVICTRDRPRLFQGALESVLAQRLAPAELIVVDDGSDPPVRAPVGLPIAVRTIRLGRAGPGAARAAALDAARHQLIAFCDDDDVWFPDHLEALVAYLQSEPDAALAYADAQWWEEGPSSEVPFSIDYDAELLRESANFILPSTAVCRVAAARAAGGFDRSLSAFEDWELWLRISLDHPIRHLRRVLGAVRFSPDGVAAAGTDWNEWARIHDRHRRRIERAGSEAEHSLRRRLGPPPRFDRRTWSEDRRELLWHSTLRRTMSFGVVSRYLIEALEREGVQVRIAPTLNQPVAGLERFYRPDDGRGRFGFYYDWRFQPGVLPPPRVMRTDWESTRVPDQQIATINRHVELVWVPSACTREIYLSCGARVPVKLLPNGVDPARFPLLEREQRETITFGTFAELSPRKGTDVLLAAFLSEFAAAEPARLLVSASHGGHAYACEDPRVFWREGLLDHGPPLLGFLQEIDVFVFPSRAEPWGMPGLEAMATGVPVIATNWGGPAEYMDAADSLPLDFRLVDCEGVVSNNRRYEGRWAEPDREHLQALMRWCFDHREEIRAMGARAAARVRHDFTWARPARMLKHDLDELAVV